MPTRSERERISLLISKTYGMHLTIFETPLINTLARWLSVSLLRLLGWRIEGNAPTEEKYVLIAAPHTSNWDFPYTLMCVLLYVCACTGWGKRVYFRLCLAPSCIGWAVSLLIVAAQVIWFKVPSTHFMLTSD